jgi:hypothetical protein
MMFLATLVAGISGALLFRIGSAVPLWAAAAASGAAAVLAARLPGAASSSSESSSAPAGASAGPPGGASARPGGESKRGALVPAQRAVVGYYVMTRGFMLAAFVGLLPYLLYRILHFSVLELAGALAAFTVLAYLTARFSQALLARLGIATIMAGSTALLAGAFVVFALFRHPWPSMIAMAVMGAASGAVRPVTMRRLSQIAGDDPAALPVGVVAGMMERIFGLCNALAIFLGTILIVETSFPTGMLLMATVYVGTQAVVFALWGSHRTVPATTFGAARGTRAQAVRTGAHRANRPSTAFATADLGKRPAATPRRRHPPTQNINDRAIFGPLGRRHGSGRHRA